MGGIPWMGLLIVAAIAYWLLRMGGIDNIKHIFGGGVTQTVNDAADTADKNISNNSSGGNFIRQVNSGGSGSHNSFQQYSNINGVVTRSSSSS